MSSLLTNKKIILSALLIVLVIAGVFGAGHGVLAHDGPANSHTNANANIIPPPHNDVTPSATGSATPDSSLSYWYGLIVIILEFIRGVLTKILGVAAYLLNVAFKANVRFVPSYDPIVQAGWVVLRDMVNGLFIIIVLWIALTIILGIEQYGGKRLLVKVLTVAVLINFSLAMVTAVVVFSNQFALVFYQKIFSADQEGDLAAMIIGYTQVQSATNFLSKSAREDLIESMDKPLTPEQEQNCLQRGQNNSFLGVGDCVTTWFRAAQKAMVKAGFNVVGKTVASTLGVPETSRLQAIGVAISVIIYLIITSAFVYAAIALWMRILALVLLSIFAPVAMIAMILPVPKAKEGWSKWQEEFLKWIFFAPVFYFLMYLALLMAYTMNKAIKETIPPGAVDIGSDARLFLSFTIVIMMLIFVGRYAKKSAGKAGEVTVGLAKKAAGLAVGVTAGVATGGTLMAVGAIARGAAKEGGIAERMAGNKFGRMLGGGALLRKGVQEREAQKDRIAEREKKYANYSVSQMQSEVKGSSLIYSEENAARIAALAKKKDGFKGVSGTEMRTYQNILSRYNQQSVIAKVKPTMANEKTIGETGKKKIAETDYGAPVLGANPSNELKAIQYTGESLTGKEIDDTLDVNELAGDDPKNKALRAGIVRNANLTQKRIEDLVQKNYSAAAKVVADMETFVGDLDGQISAIDTQIAAGGTAQEIAALSVKKSALQTQRAPKQAILNNLRTTPGGRALGLTAPALELTGSRVITGRADSLTVDVKSRIRGGSGRYTFEFPPGVTFPGFQIDQSGILSTDPGAPPPPGSRHSITVQVTDAADPTHPTPITLNAVINP